MLVDRTAVGKLLKAGMSYSKIGERFNVSRQNIHQIALKCYPEITARRRVERARELSGRRSERKHGHFLRCELPWLVKEWMYEAGYARCAVCELWQSLDVFPPSAGPYKGSICRPCKCTQMKNWRERIPKERRILGGWRNMTPEQKTERIKAARAARWGTVA